MALRLIHPTLEYYTKLCENCYILQYLSNFLFFSFLASPKINAVYVKQSIYSFKEAILFSKAMNHRDFHMGFSNEFMAASVKLLQFTELKLASAQRQFSQKYREKMI